MSHHTVLKVRFYSHESLEEAMTRAGIEFEKVNRFRGDYVIKNYKDANFPIYICLRSDSTLEVYSPSLYADDLLKSVAQDIIKGHALNEAEQLARENGMSISVSETQDGLEIVLEG